MNSNYTPTDNSEHIVRDNNTLDLFKNFIESEILEIEWVNNKVSSSIDLNDDIDHMYKNLYEKTYTVFGNTNGAASIYANVSCSLFTNGCETARKQLLESFCRYNNTNSVNNNNSKLLHYQTECYLKVSFREKNSP